MEIPFQQRLRLLIRRIAMPNPTNVKDAQPSMILYDDHGPATPRLLDLAIGAIQHARTEDLSAISARMSTAPRWPDIWPGEHYKLLAGIVKVLQPQRIIEVGTYQGLSAITMAKHLPQGARLYTYDITPYEQIPGHIMLPSDFAGDRIVQIIADLAERSSFEANREILESADLVFVDASKDGVFEQVLLDRFETLRFRRPPIVVFDDIRLWNMLGIWRRVTRHKLDLTSFGHWSGTGLVDW